MTLTYKMLGQIRPANTTAASIYSPPDNTQVIVKSIIVCNTSGASANGSVFVHNTGSSFNESTAIMWEAPVVNGAASLTIECNICLNDTLGNIGVKTSVNNALTFTLFGTEIV